MTSYMTTEHGAHGILGLSSPWSRGKVREPLRSELASLIPSGWTVGLAVAPNNGPCRVWVNSPAATSIKEWRGYDAEGLIRQAIAWIGLSHESPLVVSTLEETDGYDPGEKVGGFTDGVLG